VFCYDASQFALLCHELAKVKMRVVDVVFLHPKKDKNASLVLLHARNGSSSLMKVHPPIIHFEQNVLSQRASEIYKKANTQSIKCQI